MPLHLQERYKVLRSRKAVLRTNERHRVPPSPPPLSRLYLVAQKKRSVVGYLPALHFTRASCSPRHLIIPTPCTVTSARFTFTPCKLRDLHNAYYKGILDGQR